MRSYIGSRLRCLRDNEPPVLGAAYQVLAPKVDADGNEIGVIRSTTVEAPSGTYVGLDSEKTNNAG